MVYLRNGTGNPLLNYSDLAQRWGLSRSTVGRLLKKLADLDYLTLMSFPGRTGSVIYLNSYLSTMFQVSDTYLSPQQLKNVEEIIEQLRPHIHDISFRTYYRRRKEAIEALSSVLWGYTAQDSLQVLEQFFPAEAGGR